MIVRGGLREIIGGMQCFDCLQGSADAVEGPASKGEEVVEALFVGNHREASGVGTKDVLEGSRVACFSGRRVG